MDVEIQITDDRAIVASPYDPDFVTGVKRIGGRWNNADKTWSVDARDEQKLRDLCIQIYGTDGSSSDVTVDVRVLAEAFHEYDEIRAFGRQLASRRYRDSKPRLADNVIVYEGDFNPTGGSKKNPRIEDSEVKGVWLEVRDVPLIAVQSEIEAFGLKADEVIEIIEDEDADEISFLGLTKAVHAIRQQGAELHDVLEHVENVWKEE